MLRKYIVERTIPGIGAAEKAELTAGARRSVEALRRLGPDIQWVRSYVTADKTYCLYLARDEDLVRKHAELSGFPSDTITEVKLRIDPLTAEQGGD